jgi:hypothetical protein
MQSSGFRLHAVIISAPHSLHQNTMHAIHTSPGGVWWGKQHGRHQLKFRSYTMIVTQWSSHCGRLSSNPCHAAGGVWWGKQNGCHTMVVKKWVKQYDCLPIKNAENCKVCCGGLVG